MKIKSVFPMVLLALMVSNLGWTLANERDGAEGGNMNTNKETAGPAPFVLPALPCADNALGPVISANTLHFHYDKHHQAYVDNLNKLINWDFAAANLR